MTKAEKDGVALSLSDGKEAALAVLNRAKQDCPEEIRSYFDTATGQVSMGFLHATRALDNAPETED